MKYEESMLLKTIGDTIENRVLDFLIEGLGIGYTVTDLSKGCNISRPTVYKALSNLLNKGVVKTQRKIGRIVLYELNKKNHRVQALLKLEELLLKGSFENIEKVIHSPKPSI